MSNSILIFTIGPVQGFIEEARRTRDLWIGSQLLVELIKAGLEVAKKAGAIPIYPTDAAAEAGSIPNRFVVRIETLQAEKVAGECEEAVKKTWGDLADKAYKKLSEFSHPSNYLKQIWDRQKDNFIEVYWSVADSAFFSDDLVAAHKEAAQTLGARKRTRTFSQALEEGQKDSLSGARAALCDEFGKDGAKNFWAAVSVAMANNGQSTLLQPEGKELLDAIGSIKRLGRLDEIQIFPSVSTIAAASFLRLVNTRGVKETLDKYRDALNKDLKGRPDHESGYVERLRPIGLQMRNGLLADWNFDGDLLYLPTFTPEYLKDSYHLDATKDDLRPLIALLRDLYRAVGTKPATYYAILMMDADHMGQTVGKSDGLKGLEVLSGKLTSFVTRARQIVESDFAGRVVYAGGDDLMALLSVADALPAAIALQKEFMAVVGQTTISAGLVIAHHQSPLSIALREARWAEEAAKRDYGRNALCLRALKRSGEHMQVGTKWSDGIEVIADLTHQFEGFSGSPSPVSSKLAFDLAEDSRSLEGWIDKPGLDAAYADRVSYLCSRHISSRETEEKVKKTRAIADGLIRFFKQRQSAREVADWALVARFIAQGGEE